MDDLPVSTGADEFHHEHYADILRDIVESTDRSGISIGLFGKWGEGKSTIIKHLEAEPPENTKTVVFNAWHAYGDSVRRQLLLKVIESLDPDKAEELKKFIGTELAYEFLRSDEEKGQSRQKAILVFAKKIVQDSNTRVWVLCLVMSFLIVFILQYYLSSSIGIIQIIINSIMLPAIGLVFRMIHRVLKNRFFGVSGISEPISESQKLKYPEQFQELFFRYASEYYERHRKKILVIVDDLDRCDPDTVMEALTSLRQLSGECIYIPKDGPFKGKKLAVKAQFLVPCDEQQVILALETAGHNADIKAERYHDYKNRELLRKFFDVVVQMDKFMPRDLVGYAGNLVESDQISLTPEEAKTIVAVADADNPRTVKKLLNALCIAKERVSRACGEGLLPKTEDMPEFRNTLIALTTLREIKPNAYEEVCKDPDLLSGHTKKKSNDERATAILKLAGPINTYTAELLITCSWDKRLAGIETGPAFHRAIRDSDSKAFSEILKKADNDNRRQLLEVFTSDAEEVRIHTQLRKMLPLICAYGQIGSEHEQAAIKVIENIILSKKVQQHLTEALDSLSDLQWIDSKLLDFSDGAQHVLLKHVLEVFQKDPREKKDALRLLLHAPKKLSQDISQTLKTTLKNHLDGLKKDEEWQVAITTIGSVLPDDWKDGAGFAPQLVQGIISRNWNDDVAEKDQDKWPTPKVAQFFLGGNKQIALSCLDTLFNSGGALSKPQGFIRNTNGLKPKWVFAKHLLQAIDTAEVQKYFNHLKAWIEQQQTGNEKAFLFDVAKPILLLLSDRQIKEISSLLCNSIIQSADNDGLIETLVRRPDDDALIKNWELFSKTFFEKFKPHAQSSGFDKWLPALLAIMVEDRWPVGKMADELLAHKLEAEQDTNKWMPYLKELMGDTITATKATVETRLKQRGNLDPVLMVGEKIVWPHLPEAEIDNHARIIAEAFLHLPSDEFSALISKHDSLCSFPVGPRALRFMSARLKREADWLLQKTEQLEYLAQHKDLLQDEATGELRSVAKCLDANPDATYQEAAKRLTDLLEK